MSVKIEWQAPSNGGSALLGYKIYIQSNDPSKFETNMVDCNGADPSIMATTNWIVPKLKLISQPFNLPWGSMIYVKIIAYNIYGDSAESVIGNGAVILTNPDAPLNLIEVYSERDATSLGLTWLEGLANGGSDVLDYSVSYD